MRMILTFMVTFCAVCSICTAQNGIMVDASSYNNELFCVVTDQDEILVSKDGVYWNVCDFNKEYEGYYRHLTIKTVAAGDRTMAIAGTDSAGSPAMYFSFDGKVWSPRELSYTENGLTLNLEEQPERLEYDPEHDRMVLYCADDVVFYVPNCSHCNSISRNNIN